MQQISSGITTEPSLFHDTVATGYPGLKMIIEIEASSYQTCSWYYGNTFLASIFNRGVVFCADRTEQLFDLTCAGDIDNSITATATFISDVGRDDSGMYEVRCRMVDLTELIVAQTEIIVSGNNSNMFLSEELKYIYV